MSPYRSPSTRLERHGPRWGATRWVKFSVKHDRLLWTLAMIVIVPAVCVTRLLTFQDPFDW